MTPGYNLFIQCVIFNTPNISLLVEMCHICHGKNPIGVNYWLFKSSQEVGWNKGVLNPHIITYILEE
jgi:hypothetical protein